MLAIFVSMSRALKPPIFRSDMGYWAAGTIPPQNKLFTSSIRTLKPLLHKKCNASLPPSTVFLAALQMRCKNIDTLLLGTPGILCAWALQGYFSVGPCRDIWWLDTAGILCKWAPQGYFAVGHCRDTLRLGTAGILGGWALQGYLVVGHCRDT